MNVNEKELIADDISKHIIIKKLHVSVPSKASLRYNYSLCLSNNFAGNRNIAMNCNFPFLSEINCSLQQVSFHSEYENQFSANTHL